MNKITLSLEGKQLILLLPVIKFELSNEIGISEKFVSATVSLTAS